MLHDTCTGIIHKKPQADDISAIGGTDFRYPFYPPAAPGFAKLSDDFLNNDTPYVMKNRQLEDEPLPLWWTSDFINADPGKPGTPCTIDKGIAEEFNCSCVALQAKASGLSRWLSL